MILELNFPLDTSTYHACENVPTQHKDYTCRTQYRAVRRDLVAFSASRSLCALSPARDDVEGSLPSCQCVLRLCFPSFTFVTRQRPLNFEALLQLPEHVAQQHII